MIDTKLQEELRTRFNPEGSDLRKYQMRLFDILCFVDDICKKHNIKYWLSSGTCLGAIRHGGFIPWDDDIDIEMMEKDYKLFCQVMKKENNDKYVFQTLENDPGYIYSFGKVRDLNSIIWESHGFDKLYKYRGCYIDVFHLESSNSIFLYRVANWFIWKQMMYKQTLISNNTNNTRTKITYYIIKFVNYLIKPLITLISQFNFCGQLRHALGSGFTNIRKYKEIFPLKYISFENRLFPIPNDYDSYLRRMFNDYNSLPNFNNIQVHFNKFKLY